MKAYFASTACRSCPTISATCAISTTEYGSTIRNRFCSSSVSYNAARCERIVESEESSLNRRLEIAKTVREKLSSDLLDNPSGPSRNQPSFGFDGLEQ